MKMMKLMINEEETNGVKWIPINELKITAMKRIEVVDQKFNKKMKELSL